MSDALALLGDYNATPQDRGRWSPSWLATEAQLRIHSAGPGRHGDIDYSVDDCSRVTRMHRAHRPDDGSDHDLVVMVLGSGSNRLRVGTWNLLYGREQLDVMREVLRALTRYDLAVLCLQEAADYHRVLANIPGWRLLAYEGAGHHNVILVRQVLDITRPQLVRLSPRGWRLVTGGTHAPLYATSCVVGWVRIVSLQLPPSVNWSRRGIIYGPPLRVAAYVAAMRRLRRWARANKRHRG